MENNCNSFSVVSNERRSYICVLVGCDSDELRFCEGESLDSSWLAGVLCPILVYFHHMEPGLVLVKGLKNHHLEISIKDARQKVALKVWKDDLSKKSYSLSSLLFFIS